MVLYSSGSKSVCLGIDHDDGAKGRERGRLHQLMWIVDAVIGSDHAALPVQGNLQQAGQTTDTNRLADGPLACQCL